MSDFTLHTPDEYPELSIAELEIEYDLHNWILSSMKKLWVLVNHKIEYWEMRNDPENRVTFGEDYVNGLITEEEYKEKKRAYNWRRSINLNIQTTWERRLFWLESKLVEEEALCYEILDIIEEKQYQEKKSPKKRKKRKRRKPSRLRYYGYDPRHNVSSRNLAPSPERDNRGNFIKKEEREKEE